MPRSTVTLLCVLATALVCAPTASAAGQRWASATASDPTGSCLSVSPCSLQHAIANAGPGDEVIVTPGTYRVSSGIVVTQAISVHGIAGEPRPHIVGAGNLAVATLSVEARAAVRHLDVEASGAGADAMTVKDGALVEDVMLSSAAGDGAKLVSDADGTVLRDSVVVSGAPGSSAAALKVRDGSEAGSVAVRNVTAYATAGSATGVLCETDVATTTLVNVISRGAAADVDATADDGHGDDRCRAEHSNLRPAASPGLPTGTGNSAAEPRLQDPAGGDFRPLAGSPTIDAGRADALLGSTDPDGHARSLGAAPDMGAFEFDAEPAADTPATPVEERATTPAVLPPPGPPKPTGTDGAPGLDRLPAGVTPPVLGRTIVLAPQGTILVRRPGARGYTALRSADDLPVGTIVDARRGTVRLSTALPAGHQTGAFRGGRFEVRQSRAARGVTDLVLRGGNFATCPKRAVRAVAAKSRRSRAVRRLWGRDRGGRFRTRGRTSVATVRGTAWLTEDRCEGTYVRVSEGAVAVRDLRRGTTRLVRAGGARLVRTRR